ncbi:MAG: ankyrin repeat domain-containing protein [Alphaproteobacteria bacterium]|nr:ankyrin repeat domain-containing protein [Alphaproteobacteria bacterium]
MHDLPLQTAAEKGRRLLAEVMKEDGCNQDFCRRLIAAGADLNVESHEGGTPLIYAAARGLPLAHDLIGAGADVDVQNHQDATALMWAAHQGHAGVVRALITHGARTDQVDITKCTARGYAVREGYDCITDMIDEEEKQRAIAIAAVRGTVKHRRILRPKTINPKP